VYIAIVFHYTSFTVFRE